MGVDGMGRWEGRDGWGGMVGRDGGGGWGSAIKYSEQLSTDCSVCPTIVLTESKL